MPRIKTLDEFEEAYREGLDQPLPPARPWREVTEEWLMRHSEGAGDYNPLFRDRQYADQARYHRLVGSPSFLFSMAFGATASIWGHIPVTDIAMEDLSILYLGADIEWHAPAYLGDAVRAVETPVDITRSEMRQLGEVAICAGRTDYYDHRSQLIATMTNRMLRFPNPGRGVESSPVGDKPRVAPDPLVWERERRGPKPRFIEDVRAGDELPALPKGTFTTTELYLFSHGSLGVHRSRAVAEGTIDMGAGGRADPEYARRSRAQSGAFDYGPQRITWMTQIVSDWMGDRGDLVSMNSQLRRPNLVGDTNTVVGRVTAVHAPDGTSGRAEVRIAVVNQDDVETASATVVVRLPSVKAAGESPVLFAPAVAPAAGVYG